MVAPCGFHLDAAAAQAELVARQLPGLPVWAIDADGLVVRPGPRLVDGVEALAAILHADARNRRARRAHPPHRLMAASDSACVCAFRPGEESWKVFSVAEEKHAKPGRFLIHDRLGGPRLR